MSGDSQALFIPMRRTYAVKSMSLLLTPTLILGLLIGSELIQHKPFSSILIVFFALFALFFLYSFLPFRWAQINADGHRIVDETINFSEIDSLFDGEILGQPFIAIMTKDKKLTKLYPVVFFDRDIFVKVLGERLGFSPHIASRVPLELTRTDGLFDGIMNFLAAHKNRPLRQLHTAPEVMRIWNRESASAVESSTALLERPYQSPIVPAFIGYLVLAAGIVWIWYLIQAGTKGLGL